MYKEYYVPVSKMEDFKSRFEKFNRKLDRSGYGQTAVMLGQTRIQIHNTDNTQFCNCYKIGVEMPDKVINDWKVLGVIQHPTRKNQQRGFDFVKFYGEDGLSKEYAGIKATRCDHCHKEISRTTQVVLLNMKTGEKKVIGRSCLSEYLGVDLDKGYEYFVDKAIMGAEDWFEEVKVEFEKAYRLENILNNGMEIIKENGYTPKACASSEIPTAVWLDRRYDKNEIFDTSIIEEFRNYLENTGYSSNFMENLKAIAQFDRVLISDLYLIAAGINMFMKNRKYQETVKKEMNSEFIGVENDKMNLDKVRVATIKGYCSCYANNAVIVVLYAGENKMVWFTNETTVNNNNLKENTEYNLKFTVKKHEEYNGVKQTVITRAKVVC